MTVPLRNTSLGKKLKFLDLSRKIQNFNFRKFAKESKIWKSTAENKLWNENNICNQQLMEAATQRCS